MPIAGWSERIAQEQLRTHVHSGGVPFPRLAYGTERPDLKPECADCGVSLGQLHVWTCCVERCPVCEGQAMWCPCIDENLATVTDEELKAQE
jgi:hypothetical protein